eukprot:scaffold29937_cov42-Phaeocystis_antarctica.AAC.1
MPPKGRVRVGHTHGPSDASPSAQAPLGPIVLAMPERPGSGPVAAPDGPPLLSVGGGARLAGVGRAYLRGCPQVYPPGRQNLGAPDETSNAL